MQERDNGTLRLVGWVLLAMGLHLGIGFVLDSRRIRVAATQPEEPTTIDVTYADEPSPEQDPTGEPLARSSTAPSAVKAPSKSAVASAAATRNEHAADEVPATDAVDPAWTVPGIINAPPSPSPENRGGSAGNGSSPMGLGGAGFPGMTNLNLDQHSVVAVVGEAEFRRTKIADSARRLEEHRAPWKGTDLRRWTSALQNYVASVRPLNQEVLGSSQIPFLRYVETMAERIRPVLADDFVAWLGTLPASHPLRTPHLSTRLELVLDRTDGHILRMGVVLTSGVTGFDVGVLDSVQRASPFGAPPAAIVSPDGRVYVQWDFKNLPYTACRAENARPSILRPSP